MTKDLIPSIERLGVNPKFIRLKAYLRECFADNDAEHELQRLARYAKEEGGFLASENDPESVYDVVYACMDLHTGSYTIRRIAIKQALGANPSEWQANWQRSVAFDYWDLRTSRVVPYFQAPTAVTADCLVLGWDEWAVKLARDICFKPRVGTEGDESSPSRIGYFVLRLIADWQGWTDCQWPKWAADEPLYNALISHWRTPDANDIAPLLLAALDRHTHESREMTARARPDIWNSDYWYDPFEVLAVLRLRQMHGLENPVLDHLLTNTPLGKLPDPTPPYTDELIEGVLAVLQRDLSEKYPASLPEEWR